MTSGVFCCIFTHGELGFYLKKVTENLVSTSIPMNTYSNQDNSSEVLEEKILSEFKIQENKKGLFLVDLAGGSCWTLANRIKKNNPEIAVLGGVNIPMLISLQVNFPRLEWEQLIKKIVEDGKKGIISR
jgi:mannose/fructose-specific phosphotransferase system component IIA